MTSIMMIPDLVATLTRERDDAIAGFCRLNDINEALRGRLHELSRQHQAALADLRAAYSQMRANEPVAVVTEPDDHNPRSDWARARALLLAARLANCGGYGCGFQPCICDPPSAVIRQAASLMDNLDPVGFTDPDLAPAKAPVRTMPARALQHDKQAIGMPR